MSDFVAAAELLQTCSQARPRNPSLHVQRAGCLFALGQFDEALAECDRAVDLAPDLRAAFRSRAMIRARLGHDGGPIEDDLSRFAVLGRDDEGRFLRWELRLNAPSPRPRVPDAPPEPAPGDVEARFQVALQLGLGGRVDSSLAELDRLLAAEPDHLRAKFARAEILCDLRRMEGVNEMAALLAHPRFDELAREDPRALQAYLEVGTMRLNGGAADEALALAELALAHSRRLPTPPTVEVMADIRYALARARVADAPDDPDAVAQAAALLRPAAPEGPGAWTAEFEQDRYFSASREAIRRAWQQARITTPAPGR